MTRTILFAALVSLSACGFDSIGDSFNCETSSDCDEFRRCVDGLCLVAGTTCHPDCDVCDNGICQMNCMGEGDCPGTVRCPPTRTCLVQCTGENSCGGGVDCTDATRCLVQCRGADSCAGLIDCATSECDVQCDSRPGACSGGVDCVNACACTTDCVDNQGGRTCLPDCPSGCDNGDECVADGCNTCDF